MKNILYLFLTIFLVEACQPPQKSNYSPRTLGAIGDSAMVTSAHPLATKIGVEILRNGGNAFDAAIAVHFALQVVFPEAGNIGGGGFALLRDKDGNVSSLDFREKAPTNASKDMYLDEDGNVIPMKSRVGHLAAGVPGSVAGMWAIHQKYGSLPWNQLVRPATKLAYNGHVLTKLAADHINNKQEVFKDANRYDIWMLDQSGWQEGDSVIQRELAATLSFIQANGRDGFYKGIVANQIAKEMQLGGGLITEDDLADYEVKWREPIVGEYKGHTIYSMAPPSSGGIALIQLLQGAEMLDITKTGHNRAKTIHLKTELERRVYADRATHLGDPDFYDVPQQMLLSEDYNKERFSTIKMNKRTSSQEIKEGKVDVVESTETTHYSIVDLEGNAVSITTTLNSFFGSGVMVQGAGFFLNNEMDDFSAKPGIPNQFGLVGAEANSIQPAKRMLSAMTPTIVEKEGALFMVLGTPGGSTIITSVFQCIMNVVDHGMTMQDAVNSKRVHSQWLPDRILYEPGGISTEDSLDLVSFGHTMELRSSVMGRVNAVLVRPDSTYEGASDYTRMDDYAEGF